MSGFDGSLDTYLAAWRDDSRRRPSPAAAQRIRAAMHRELAAPAARRARWLVLPPVHLRMTRLRLALVGSSLALAGCATVATLGWNAPAGSPLYSVRAARQSVALVLPGADLASLHLQYAEQSLADARNRTNIAASLADAGSELTQARNELPADQAAPLWTRWQHDETQLATEQADFEREQETSSQPGGEGATAPAVVGAPAATPEPSERAGGTAEPSETAQPSTPAPSEQSHTSEPSPQPSADGGSGGTDH